MGVANGAVKELTVVFFFPRGFKLVHLYCSPVLLASVSPLP